MEVTFKLVKVASTTGGDRYEAEDFKQMGKPWTVWFPQEISRKTGTPAKEIKITI